MKVSFFKPLGGSRTTAVVACRFPLMLRGVRDAIAALDHVDIAAATRDGPHALELIRQHQPALAVLDEDLWEFSLVELLDRLGQERPGTRIVFLADGVRGQELRQAVRSGLAGLVLKTQEPAALIRCVTAVSGGRTWYPDGFLQTAFARKAPRAAAEDDVTQILTPRERAVMHIAAQGLSNKRIGRQLSLSEGTIKFHLHRIYQKLGVSNRTELATLSFSLAGS